MDTFSNMFSPPIVKCQKKLKKKSSKNQHVNYYVEQLRITVVPLGLAGSSSIHFIKFLPKVQLNKFLFLSTLSSSKY